MSPLVAHRLRLTVGLSVLYLAACSPVDIIKDAVMPSKGLEVDTEIVAGDKKQEVAKGAVLGKADYNNTSNQADNITQTYTTNEASSEWWAVVAGFMGGLLLGWLFLPDAWKMRERFRR